jgi:hypothetical protein
MSLCSNLKTNSSAAEAVKKRHDLCRTWRSDLQLPRRFFIGALSFVELLQLKMPHDDVDPFPAAQAFR